MSIPAPARLRRRWPTVVGVGLIVALTGLASLPWLIAGPLRFRVDQGLNRAFAPGRIRFEALHLSWFGPTRFERVSILDPSGAVVVQSPSVTLSRTFGQILWGDRSPATLLLDGASLDVHRAETGSIDLVEALRSVIATPDPERDLTIRVANGSLRYRDPFLAEPTVADAVDLTIRVPFAPAPITWSARLAQGDASLEVQGDFDAWLSKGGSPRMPELQVGVVGKRWPFVARTAGVDAFGRLDGSIDFARKRGRWILSGDARLDGLNAKGKGLTGDTLVFHNFEAGWDLAEGEEGWKIRRLSVVSPLGRLKAEGQLNGPSGTGQQRIEGTVDLAEVARQLPRTLHIREGLAVERGSARIVVDLDSLPGSTTCSIEAKVSDLAARDGHRRLGLQEPATFTAVLVREGGHSRVDRLSVQTAFLNASARGGLTDGVTYSGSVDLGGLRRQLGEWVEVGGLDLAGRGEFAGTYRTRPADPNIAPIGEATARLSNDSELESFRFEQTFKAKFKDLRVEQLGPVSIRRDSAEVDLSAGGEAGPTGLPRGWRQIGLALRSGKFVGALDLTDPGGQLVLEGRGSAPLSVGSRTRMVTFRMGGTLSEDRRQLRIDSIGGELAVPDGDRPSYRLALAAKGRFDLGSGELVLEPLPSAGLGSIAIDPEGLRISGIGQGLGSLRSDGGLSGDLAGLDAFAADATGRAPLGLSGRWSAVGNVRGADDGLTLAGRFGVEDRSATAINSRRATGLAFRAHYEPAMDRLDLSEFTVSSPFGTLDASGKLEQATGDAVVDLKGLLSPDFAAITARLAATIEPGARIDGRPRAFRASGPIGGEGTRAWKGLEAEVGFDLAGADIYGMKFGPSPVVLRASRGRLAFDPISTTLNEGHVRLEPEVDLDAAGGPILRLAKNSNIREARINDEVSKRVLAFVAPILDQATRASGLVSVDLDHAEFPLGPGRGRQTKVEGAVVFQNVEFGPGPLAGEILGAIGRRDLSLKLDQPVTLTIADGRVNQRGMTIPIGELTRIELDGWVDFDRNLALNASLPVTPAMMGNNPLLSEIVAGTKVRLPISGTLDRPRVDRDAFSANLQDLGKSLLTRGATRGVMELLTRLARPRDPDAPPPPPRLSPEERRARRQEKKAIQRGEIPPPDPSPRP